MATGRSRLDSVDNLESLTDVELHKKLLEYGLPNVPVTETTRNLLIKRLRNHITAVNNKRKIENAKMRKTLTNARAEVNTTQPMNFTQPSYCTINTPKNTPVEPYQNRMSTNLQTISNFGNYENQAANQQQRSSPKMYAPPPIFASDSCDDFRKTLFNTKSARPHSQFNDSSPKYINQNQIHDVQMGMVGRLLSFRDATLRKKAASSPTTSMTSESQKINYRSMKISRDAASSSSLKQFFSRFNLQRGSQQSIISQVLVCAFFIFFIAIALIYTTMGSDYSNAIKKKTTLSVVCDASNTDIMHSNCIAKEHLDKALQLTKELLKILQDRITHYYCVNNSKPTALSVSDFISSRSEYVIEKDKRSLIDVLRDMEHLINNNPQWKIGITNKNGEPVSITDQSILSAHDTFFKLLKPNLPMFCVFISKLTQFFTLIGTATLIVGFLAICYCIYYYVKQKKKFREELIERFVSDIINELIEASKRGYDDEIVLINLRDKILPLSNRNSFLKAWNKAVQLLELNDSRIQFGLKLKNGEEVRTLKWIGGTPDMDVNDTTKAKKWQSPAFDNRNQVIHPPTPCLKIRHMFDCTEINNPNLSQLIYNAIMEKVGPKCKICDIQLDKQTCCVYVRCATEEDAGIIHNEINGWWFDKRLVSIKFLRLERYLNRFPKSLDLQS